MSSKVIATPVAPATPAPSITTSNILLQKAISKVGKDTQSNKFAVLALVASQGLTVDALSAEFKIAKSTYFPVGHARMIRDLATIKQARPEFKDYAVLASTYRGYLTGGKSPLGKDGALKAMLDTSVSMADIVENKPKRSSKPAGSVIAGEPVKAGAIVTLTDSNFIPSFMAYAKTKSFTELATLITTLSRLEEAVADLAVPVSN